MTNISKLFCCFTPDQSEYSANAHSGSNSSRTSRNNSVPVKVPSKSDIRTQGNPNKVASSSTANHGISPSTVSNVPLEYVNPGEQPPEELAIKGRRHSAALITTSQTPSVASCSQIEDVSAGNGSGNQDSRGNKDPLGDHHKDSHRNHGSEDTEDNIDSNENYRAIDNDCQTQVGEMFPPNAGSEYALDDLLPPVSLGLAGRKCLVLDLDETLVHSSFKYIWNSDFVIPVEIEGTVHDVYVAKRPGVDEFLKWVSQFYEVVVFTASVAKYGDPLLDRLDPNNYVHHRLFRESCYHVNGSYIKNLAWLGRPLSDTIIIDNSPAAYAMQPFNAVPVSSWFSDVHDNELLDMLPILEDLASTSVPDVSRILRYEW